MNSVFDLHLYSVKNILSFFTFQELCFLQLLSERGRKSCIDAISKKTSLGNLLITPEIAKLVAKYCTNLQEITIHYYRNQSVVEVSLCSSFLHGGCVWWCGGLCVAGCVWRVVCGGLCVAGCVWRVVCGGLCGWVGVCGVLRGN